MSLAFLSGSCCYIPVAGELLSPAEARTIIDTGAQFRMVTCILSFEVPEVIIIWA
jgi:hypothetical protein